MRYGYFHIWSKGLVGSIGALGLLVGFVLLSACGGGNTSGGTPPPPPPAPDPTLIWAVTSSPSAGPDAPLAMARDSAYLYVVGYDESPGYLDTQWRIEKRSLADGSPSASFGTAGVVASNPSSQEDAAQAIAIDSTYMYVAGYDESPGTNDVEWRLEKRSLADGSLIAGFGSGGVVTSNPSTGADAVQAIAVDSTYLYAAGYDEVPGNGQWRIEKRRLTDGALDPGFGAGGVVVSNIGARWDAALAVAIASGSLVIAGFDSGIDGFSIRWRIEKRGLTDGSLITAFDTDGILALNPSPGPDAASGVAIDATQVYVAGYDWSPFNYEWRMEKRSLTDGSLAPAFGTGGAITNNPSTGPDRAYAMVIDSSYLYVAGYDDSPAPGSLDYQWRVEKRSLLDGSLAPDFGAGGVVTVNPGPGSDIPYALAADADSLYVAGRSDANPGLLDYDWRIEKRSKVNPVRE